MIYKYRANILALSIIFLVGFAVFGNRSQYLGFYADDAAFLLSIRADMSLSDLITAISAYVPGRNLHIVWQYLIAVASGGSGIENLAGMHFIQAIADCVNAMLLYCALIAWGSCGIGAFIAALTFLIAPTHGETHFWLSALPMNIVSTFFVLLLLLIIGVIIKKIDLKNKQSMIAYVFVAILPIYLGAIFTYDQTSPVALALVTFFCLYCFITIKKMKALMIIFWLIFLAFAFSIIVWKAINPGGGPSFFHLTPHHIYITFLESLVIWLKTFFWQFNIFRNSGFITHQDLVSVICLTALSMVSVYILLQWSLRLEENQSPSLSKVRSKTSWQLVAGGALFFLLAYLPGYIWFLSPRHSYLPSVGVAMVIAGLISAIPLRLLRLNSVAISLAAISGYIWIGFFSANLVEKEHWISAYDLRKQMYDALSHSFPGINSSLLLVDFPNTATYGAPSLAFLTGESGHAIPIITSQGVSFERFVLHPVPAKKGFFMRTEEGRWGKDSLGFIPDNQAIALMFRGYDGKQLSFSVDWARKHLSTDKYYSLKPVETVAVNNTDEFSAIRTSHGYQITVPKFQIKDGETYALLGLVREGSVFRKATYNTKNDPEKFLIPIDLAGGYLYRATVFDLEYKVPMESLQGFGLYQVNADGARLIKEVPIK